MKTRFYKSMITIEASVIFTVAIYVILIILDIGIYLYDTNALNAQMVRGTLKVQNHLECKSGLQDGNIELVYTKMDDRNLGLRIKKIIDGRLMLSRLRSLRVSTSFTSIDVEAEIEYKGLSLPFKNLKIKKNMKFANMSPSVDIRRSRHIHSVIDGDK